MKWFDAKRNPPPAWESVLGFMPNAAPFPQVRECYLIDDGRFFFPALKRFEEVSLWAEIPTPKELGV